MRELAQIKVHALELPIHLGCTKEERAKPQNVLIDVTLTCKNPPQGMKTDNLNDTICYADVIDAIQASLKEKHVHLIEHLGHLVHEAIESLLAEKQSLLTTVELTIHKPNPPIPYPQKGVSFNFVKVYGETA